MTMSEFGDTEGALWDWSASEVVDLLRSAKMTPVYLLDVLGRAYLMMYRVTFGYHSHLPPTILLFARAHSMSSSQSKACRCR
jgi:hypothetical protein